jgi:hypothetical protein
LGLPRVLNQYAFIFFKKRRSIANPDAEPITESTLQTGQIAHESFSSTHVVIALSGKVAGQ